MDNHFVPNLTFGPPVIKSLKASLSKQDLAYFLDAHLMVTDPKAIIPKLENIVDSVTFHCEAVNDIGSVIDMCKKHNIKASLAIKPNTALSPELIHFCKRLDSVLIMTVEPGFGGQSMIASCLSKVKTLRKEYPDLDIQVDGGINKDTILSALEAGANNFVVGSGLFKHPQGVLAAFEELHALIH